MPLIKKFGLGSLNLALVALVVWYAYQTYEEYFNNPWTRDGQVRGHVIQIAPRVSGMVIHIPVIDNQFVHQGDLLFEIDREPFEIAIAQAEANLQRARISSKSSKIEYDRLKDIFNKDPGAVSQKDLNRREANYLESLSQIDVQTETLRSAKLNLGYTSIYAPVDGYVSNVDFQIGTQAVANTQQAGFKHTRGDAAVTAHGIVAASAERAGRMPIHSMLPFCGRVSSRVCNGPGFIELV